MLRRSLDRIVEAHYSPGFHTERLEETAEVATQVWVTTNAQHTHSA